MSNTEASAADAPSLYAALLQEIQQAIDALSTHHNQVAHCQVIRSQQAISNNSLWNERFDKIFELYSAGSQRLPYPDPIGLGAFHALSVIMSADAELSDLNNRLQKNQEQMLNHEMGLATQQLDVSYRLIQNIAKLMEQLRKDEERMQERQRKLADLAWQLEVQQKGEFVRSWVQNDVVTDEEGRADGGIGVSRDEVRDCCSEGEEGNEADETLSWQS